MFNIRRASRRVLYSNRFPPVGHTANHSVFSTGEVVETFTSIIHLLSNLFFIVRLYHNLPACQGVISNSDKSCRILPMGEFGVFWSDYKISSQINKRPKCIAYSLLYMVGFIYHLLCLCQRKFIFIIKSQFYFLWFSNPSFSTSQTGVFFSNLMIKTTQKTRGKTMLGYQP